MHTRPPSLLKIEDPLWTRQSASAEAAVPEPLAGKNHPFDLIQRLYFTIDCDWVPGSDKGLEALIDCCDRYHMTATVFFTGRFVQAEFVFQHGEMILNRLRAHAEPLGEHLGILTFRVSAQNFALPRRQRGSAAR